VKVFAKASFPMPARRLLLRQASRLSYLVVLLGILFTGAAFADLIILKDGAILTGKVKQSGSYVEGLPISDGTFIMDAGARRVFFSHTQVEDVDDKDTNQGREIMALEIPAVKRLAAPSVDPIDRVFEPGPWGPKWERNFRFYSEQFGNERVQQRLGLLTPEYARVDAVKLKWEAYYLTSEFGPATVRKLLLSYPGWKNQKPPPSPIELRLRIYRFLAQAGWYEQAEEELDGILQEFPGEKEQVEKSRQGLKEVRRFEIVSDVERAYQAGQHRWAQKQLADFPTQGTDEKLLARVRALKAKYEAANDSLNQAGRLLKELAPRVKDTSQRKLFEQAVAAILKEIHIDDFLPPAGSSGFTLERIRFQRLDSFLSLALQAERDEKNGRAPTNSSTELLSLAVSGWLLGKNSAETKFDTAEKLWKARQFVLAYQKIHDAVQREQRLKEYQSIISKALEADEMAQLIRLLPPADSAPDLSSDPMELRTELADVNVAVTYLLQLPPEYHHERSYPVLMALHQAGEKAQDMLDRLSEQAAKNGYILVAPAWGRLAPAANNYSYTVKEQAAVTDVLLDLRRRFQIDSDRVFLTGFGEGANMAYDVGLSHPDLFAGVLPVGGRLQFFASAYWRNGQNLPFYVVDGDHTGKSSQKLYKLFKEQLIPRGFPWLLVQYKGRGLEWFQGEVPFMFDWMSHKRGLHRRARAVPDLGKNGGGGPLGLEFYSMRQKDNQFYWLSTDSIANNSINSAVNWNPLTPPATFQGNVFLEQNQVNVNVRGLKKVTVWLGRDMIDFTKPATIRVNGAPWGKINRKITPSLSALLEDFYLREDRQRLFFARLDIKP
jgi:predicted esterase